MSWNYRIVKHADKRGTWFGLHEVYYDKGGKPKNMTTTAIEFIGDSAAEIKRSLELALKDARKYQVFVPPKRWK